MDEALIAIAAIINSDVAKKAYDDALSGPMKQVGKLGTDLSKTARLFLAPVQITAAYQDRLEAFLKRLAERVPEERRIEVSPQVAGPALSAMRYIDSEDALWSMFTELLCKAADKDTVQYVHPAFVHILQQLTRDEAYLLVRLSEQPFKVLERLSPSETSKRLTTKSVVETEVPYKDLHQPAALGIYQSHLVSLSLIEIQDLDQQMVTLDDSQTGVEVRTEIRLTEFGSLFVDACTPDLPADGP